MTMMTREPECLILKRRGAEHVAQLLAGKSIQEQLDYWQLRTEALLAKQKKDKSQLGQSITNIVS